MERLISVIIPCYNVEAYLPRCIDSVIRQPYQNLEIILVDDGSPDRCGQICDEYARRDSRIVVVHQKNQGISAARNTGIELAKGDYLFFVDSDDFIFPNALSVLVQQAVAHDADLVSAEYVKAKRVEDINLENDGRVVVGDGAQVLDHVLRVTALSPWGKLFRRELIGDDRFVVGHIYEDFEFIPRQYLKANRCVHLSQKLYFYFDRETGFMGASKCCLKPYYVDFAQRNLNVVAGSRYSAEAKAKLDAGLYMHFMWDYSKPARDFGMRQGKELRDAFRAFLRQHFRAIMRNRYLERRFKLRYLVLMLSPGLFESIFIAARGLRRNRG